MFVFGKRFSFFSKTHLCSLAAALSLWGCMKHQVSAGAETNIDQTRLCEVHSWRHDEVAQVCKTGQKVAFIPESFGNEQLPVIFAAVNCDLRYHVALTHGAVTCIYGPITPTPTSSTSTKS